MTNARKIPMPIISKMSREQFADVLGGVFEHAPWVAEAAWDAGPFRTRELLHDTMMEMVRRAAPERQLKLLRGHPDLATRLAVTDHSAMEQRSAGLDRLSEAEYETFMACNAAYTDKFGFPFIMAVRGKDKADILAAMRARIANDAETERETALAEIRRITGFRLADLLEA